jgi:hypothetical protein
MNWYKKAQYEVEKHQAVPTPSISDRAQAPRDTASIEPPLPSTPDIEEEYPVAAVVVASGKIFKGKGHAEAIQKAIDAGYATKDEDGYLIDTEGNMLAFNGGLDLFLTNKGRIIDRFEAFAMGCSPCAEKIPEEHREITD